MNPHTLVKGNTYTYEQMKGCKDVVYLHEAINSYVFRCAGANICLTYSTVKSFIKPKMKDELKIRMI